MPKLYGFGRDDARTLRGVARSVRQTSNKNQCLKYPTPGGLTSRKSLVRFTLNAALTESDDSQLATITDQFGPGLAADASIVITVHNHLTSTPLTYEFSGASGDAGIAAWDSGLNYRIIQLEC